MSILVVKNNTTTQRCVVIDIHGSIRPVASVSKDTTLQCICNGDVVVYRNCGQSQYQYTMHGKQKLKASSVEVSSITMECIKNFLDDTCSFLPKGMGWNGVDTIQSMAVSLGLDTFLNGLAPSAILGGLMGLDTSLRKPKMGMFNVEELQWNTIICKNSTDNTVINNLLKHIGNEPYVAWLKEKGVCVPEKYKNWRGADRLPTVMSVSCIMKEDGTPMRYNDLIVWKKEQLVPEIISIFDLVTTFKMKTNFISLPYVVGKDVTRIMYILHGENISDSGNNVIKLYRNR